jgi:hypothetical protein
MLSKLRLIRLLLSIVSVVAGAGVALSPGIVFGDEPCQYSSLAKCRDDMAHIYQGECEGIDCYYELEDCCPLVE